MKNTVELVVVTEELAKVIDSLGYQNATDFIYGMTGVPKDTSNEKLTSIFAEFYRSIPIMVVTSQRGWLSFGCIHLGLVGLSNDFSESISMVKARIDSLLATRDLSWTETEILARITNTYKLLLETGDIAQANLPMVMGSISSDREFSDLLWISMCQVIIKSTDPLLPKSRAWCTREINKPQNISRLGQFESRLIKSFNGSV